MVDTTLPTVIHTYNNMIGGIDQSNQKTNSYVLQ